MGLLPSKEERESCKYMNITLADVQTPYHPCLNPGLRFNERNLIKIIINIIFWILSFIGNVPLLFILLNNLKKSANHVQRLILHMNIADLLVTFYVIPYAIFSESTVIFHGTDFLCRISKFLEAFSVYLGSDILILITMDRCFTIIYPLYPLRANRRIRFALLGAWIVAIIASLPQLFLFAKIRHPRYSWYTKCNAITLKYRAMLFQNRTTMAEVNRIQGYIIGNTILNWLMTYLMPMFVIMFCYTAIFIKININNRKRKLSESQNRNNTHNNHSNRAGESDPGKSPSSNTPKISSGSSRFIPSTQSFRGRRNAHIRAPSSASAVLLSIVQELKGGQSNAFHLTAAMVVIFLFCWTPYFVAAVCAFLFPNSVHPMLETILYLIPTFNTVANPYLYAYFSIDVKQELRDLLVFFRCRERKRQSSIISNTDLNGFPFGTPAEGTGAANPQAMFQNIIEKSLQRQMQQGCQKETTTENREEEEEEERRDSNLTTTVDEDGLSLLLLTTNTKSSHLSTTEVSPTKTTTRRHNGTLLTTSLEDEGKETSESLWRHSHQSSASNAAFNRGNRRSAQQKVEGRSLVDDRGPEGPQTDGEGGKHRTLLSLQPISESSGTLHDLSPIVEDESTTNNNLILVTNTSNHQSSTSSPLFLAASSNRHHQKNPSPAAAGPLNRMSETVIGSNCCSSSGHRRLFPIDIEASSATNTIYNNNNNNNNNNSAHSPTISSALTSPSVGAYEFVDEGLSDDVRAYSDARFRFGQLDYLPSSPPSQSITPTASKQQQQQQQPHQQPQPKDNQQNELTKPNRRHHNQQQTSSCSSSASALLQNTQQPEAKAEGKKVEDKSGQPFFNSDFYSAKFDSLTDAVYL